MAARMWFLLFAVGVAVAGAAGGGGAGLAAAVERFVFWVLGSRTKVGTVNAALEAAAYVASALGFLIPGFTTIAAIRHEGAVGVRSSVPFSAGLLNCVLLIYSGVLPDGYNEPIIKLNVAGAVAMFCYLLTFLQYCDADQFAWALVFPTAGVLSIPCLVALYLSDRDQNVLFFSWVCALSKGLTTLAPLLNLSVSMPPPAMSAWSLLTSLAWIGFGWTPEFDGFVVWPGVIGFASAALQVLMHIAGFIAAVLQVLLLIGLYSGLVGPHV